MIEKTYPVATKLAKNGLIHTQKLFQLLGEEASILRKNQTPELLAGIAAEKQLLVTQLNQFTKQLSQILNTENLALDQNGIKNYLEKAKNAGLKATELSQYWFEITELSKKCRDRNERNGASIDLLTRHNQRSLQIIKGSGQTINTYGPDGTTSSELNSQNLVSSV
jgi:flagella synthesis protein FlgN